MPDLPDLWVDCLQEKHEFFRYGEWGYQTIRVHVGEKTITVIVPPIFEGGSVLCAAENNGVLFILGHRQRPGDSSDMAGGVMMVAKPLADGRWAVAVFHELYTHALRHLGIEAGIEPG